MTEQSATLQYVVGIYTLHFIIRYVVLNCVTNLKFLFYPELTTLAFLFTRIQIPVQIGHIANGQAFS